jgi:hypothetical protein
LIQLAARQHDLCKIHDNNARVKSELDIPIIAILENQHGFDRNLRDFWSTRPQLLDTWAFRWPRHLCVRREPHERGRQVVPAAALDAQRSKQLP